MNPGFGMSLMWPTNPDDKPIPGWCVTAQGGGIVAGQAGHNYGEGGGDFTERGYGTPGGGVTGYYVFGPINLSK